MWHVGFVNSLFFCPLIPFLFQSALSLRRPLFLLLSLLEFFSVPPLPQLLKFSVAKNSLMRSVLPVLLVAARFLCPYKFIQAWVVFNPIPVCLWIVFLRLFYGRSNIGWNCWRKLSLWAEITPLHVHPKWKRGRKRFEAPDTSFLTVTQ